jgi:hypothetical protein
MGKFFREVEKAVSDFTAPLRNVLPKVTVGGHRYDLGGSRMLVRGLAAVPAVGLSTAPIFSLVNNRGNDVTPVVAMSTVAGALVAGGSLMAAGSTAAGATVASAPVTAVPASGASGLINTGISSVLPSLIKPLTDSLTGTSKTSSSTNIITSSNIVFYIVGAALFLLTVIYIRKNRR